MLLQKMDNDGAVALAALPPSTPDIDNVVNPHVNNLASRAPSCPSSVSCALSKILECQQEWRDCNPLELLRYARNDS